MSLDAEDKQWISQELAKSHAELREEFAEKLEGMEARLLTALQKWPSALEARLRAQASFVQALEMDMVNIKERLDKLEGKKPTA